MSGTILPSGIARKLVKLLRLCHTVSIMRDIPRVGVGLAVFIWRDGKFIMSRRKGSHGSGTHSVPGGHIEFGESWAETAAREAAEEVGVTITNVRYIATTNDIMTADGKHYVSIWVEADWTGGEPQIMEPDKVEQIEWRDFHDLPSPLFEPCWTNLRTVRPDLFE